MLAILIAIQTGAVANPLLQPYIPNSCIPQISRVADKSATCLTGKIPVSVTATNTKLLLPEPANQTVVTGLVQEFLQFNSNIFEKINRGTTSVKGTYKVEGTFCYPGDTKKAQQVQTVQVLTHGVGLDKSYWDTTPWYSYVNAAADAGYATVAYNRLGVGNSDHPDPIQVVQGAVDVEILHGIVGLLRGVHIGSRRFKNVVAYVER